MRPTNFTYDVEFSEAVTAGRLISFSPRLNAAVHIVMGARFVLCSSKPFFPVNKGNRATRKPFVNYKS